MMNYVRYDSPILGGFSRLANWSENDDWQMAAYYAGQWNEFKIQLSIGYAPNTDERISGTAVMISKDAQFFQVGGYAEHRPTDILVNACQDARG